MYLWWGAPTKDKYSFGSHKKLSDANINVNMVSNGYLLDYDTAKKLVESGISLIQISIDGFEEDHDWLRGKIGSFKRPLIQ